MLARRDTDVPVSADGMYFIIQPFISVFFDWGTWIAAGL